MSTPKRGTQHARNISSPKSAKSSLIGHFRRHSKRGSLGSVFTPAHLKGPGQVVGEDDVDRVEIKPLDSEKRSGFASALGSLRGLGRSKRNTQHEQAATPPPRRETPSPEEQPLPSSPINIPAPALPLELIPVSPSLLNSPEANRAQELMAMTDPSKVIHGLLFLMCDIARKRCNADMLLLHRRCISLSCAAARADEHGAMERPPNSPPSAPRPRLASLFC